MEAGKHTCVHDGEDGPELAFTQGSGGNGIDPSWDFALIILLVIGSTFQSCCNWGFVFPEGECEGTPSNGGLNKNTREKILGRRPFLAWCKLKCLWALPFSLSVTKGLLRSLHFIVCSLGVTTLWDLNKSLLESSISISIHSGFSVHLTQLL